MEKAKHLTARQPGQQAGEAPSKCPFLFKHIASPRNPSEVYGIPSNKLADYPWLSDDEVRRSIVAWSGTQNGRQKDEKLPG